MDNLFSCISCLAKFQQCNAQSIITWKIKLLAQGYYKTSIAILMLNVPLEKSQLQRSTTVLWNPLYVPIYTTSSSLIQ